MSKPATSKKMTKGDWVAAALTIGSFAFLGMIPALFW